MNTAKPLPLDKLSKIFRAQKGDRAVYSEVTLEEVGAYRQAETFEEFLAVNRLPAFDEVIR
jgi:hypothetical protein